MYTATNTPEWHIKYLMRGEELENLLCSKICFSKLWLYMFFKNTDNSTFFIYGILYSSIDPFFIFLFI